MTDIGLLDAALDAIHADPDSYDARFMAARWKLGARSKTTYNLGGHAIRLAGGVFDWRSDQCGFERSRRCNIQYADYIVAGTTPVVGDGRTAWRAALAVLEINDRAARDLFSGDEVTLPELERIVADVRAGAYSRFW